MVTLADALERATRAVVGGFRFLEESGGEDWLTFAELLTEADRIGGGLLADGLRPGATVGLVLSRPRDFVVAFLGAVRVGAVPVPLYPPAVGLRRLEAYAAGIREMLARAGAQAVVADPAVCDLLRAESHRVSVPALLGLEGLRGGGARAVLFRPAPSDPCFVQFTSGSTARPRGIRVTHGNLAANVRAFMHEGLRVTPEDSGVTWLPLYHDMGLIGFVLGPLWTQNTVTFLSPQSFLKRPLRWLQALSRHRATVSFGPSFAYSLVTRRLSAADLDGLRLDRWRVAGCGAEPVHAPTLAAFAERLAPTGFERRSLVACYGLAEATLAVTFADLDRGITTDAVDSYRLAAEARAEAPTEADAPTQRIPCCGRPFRDHEVAIFAPEDGASERPLAPRRVGEIRVRGPSVAPSAEGEPLPALTAAAGGWLRTGDLGYLAEGELYVCGRLKELIIIHGRKYIPSDLEAYAAEVDGVRRGHVVAFGAASPSTHDERLVFAVEARTSEPAARARIAREVARAVANATGLLVSEVSVLGPGALPRTSSGKLRRAEVRARHAGGELTTRGARRRPAPVLAD